LKICASFGIRHSCFDIVGTHDRPAVARDTTVACRKRLAYLQRGITDDLGSGTGKSREREIAAPYQTDVSSIMKMNESAKLWPLRTLMVCFTIWLIATEVLVFDQLKFDARAELLDQAARALRGSQLNVPSERPSNLPGDASMENL
jgi:hypothetical protein